MRGGALPRSAPSVLKKGDEVLPLETSGRSRAEVSLLRDAQTGEGDLRGGDGVLSA